MVREPRAQETPRPRAEAQAERHEPLKGETRWSMASAVIAAIVLTILLQTRLRQPCRSSLSSTPLNAVPVWPRCGLA